MGADKLHINIKQSGFTMLELLVAITLIVIGLSAAASMQAIAVNSNSVANKVSVSSFLAQQVAEEISSRNMSDPLLNSNSGGTYQFVDWSTGVEVLTNSLTIPGAGTFTATYTIKANTYNGATFAGMTEITVTVNNITYTTYKMVL